MTTANSKWASIYGSLVMCERCSIIRPIEELNAEAVHHHSAKQLECIDRKECNKAIKFLKKHPYRNGKAF